MIVWIHKTDRAAYESLMAQEHASPVVYAEDETNIQVGMTSNAMSVWVMIGNWYTM